MLKTAVSIRCRLLLLLALLSVTAWGAPDTEKLLEQQDQYMLTRLNTRFPVDDRYNDELNTVSLKVLPHVPELFGKQEHPQLQFGVYLSDLGFNAFTLHRTVLLDTLLLDGLTRMCQGAAVYGSLQNSYTEKLANYIATLHSQEKLGVGKDFDPRNPYRIPPPPGLTPELNAKAQKMFEETLGALVCHEVSHVFLGHMRDKLTRGLKLREELLAQGMDPVKVDQEVSRVVNYELGPAREFEADRMGARLARASGYPVESFRRSLLFINRLESYLEPGVEIPILKAHPPPGERWKGIKAAYGGGGP